MTSISRRTTGRLFCCWTMPEKGSNGHCHGMQGADRRGVRKISPDQVKAMLYGSVQGKTEETMEPPGSPAQQENIEREAVDSVEGITALMTGQMKCMIQYQTI